MISKLTIDKSSMNISYFLYTIKIIAMNGGKVSRKNFVNEMAKFVGVPAEQDDKENRTAYNKSKLPRYFGFVDIVINNDNTSSLVLTNRGKILSKYIKDNGENIESSQRFSLLKEHRLDFIDLIFDSVIFDSFGKNNSGAEQSNTDVEPPKVVFKTIYELGRATAEEICYVMFGLNNGVFNTFEEAINKVKENRLNGTYDYSNIMEDWKITNIVNDCKIINIFTDSSISLLRSEKNLENGKVYYQLSKFISDSHKEQLKTLSAIYEPLKLFAYIKGDRQNIENWVNTAVLGRVSDNSQIFRYQFGNESIPFCATQDEFNFEPGIFERAILAAFNNEKKNIYLVLNNISELNFFEKIKKYASLFKRIDNVKSDWHGWSSMPIENEKFNNWLRNNSVRARNILEGKKVVLPSNIHIVGMINMNEENKNTEFDYKFRRCLIDFDNEDIIVEDLSEEELGRKLKESYDSDVSDKVTGIYLFGIKYGKLILQKNYNKRNIINYSGINESYYAELNKAINISAFVKILNGNEKYIVQEFNESERIQGAYNMIYYGTPGCGKSYKVNKDFNDNDYIVYRTTFHPEYSNSDFVGQIIPKTTESGGINYEFQEGPFSLALCEAIKNPSKKVCLIIEEINRGNASAIFGDIFQLLDRKEDGSSVYDINNEPVKNYLNKNGVKVDKIKIPSNMWLIATMNTSDQNVFTLDTAFKRRWRMHRIINKFNKEEEYDNKLASMYIPGSSYTWEQFIITINDAIMDKNPTGLNSEDKKLGVYFVTENELSALPVNDDKEAMDRFIEKVLLYIWDDVAKLDPTLWFEHNINSFDELVKSYYDNKLHIFRDMFKDQNNESQVEEINERN